MNTKNYVNGRQFNASAMCDEESVEEPMQTLDVKAEEVNDGGGLVKRKKPRNFNGASRRIGSLPWKDMLAYYMRGENVIDGGAKYVEEPSYQDVANKFNCSVHTVAARGREDDWVEKKKAYRNKLANDFSFHGQMAAEINGEVLNSAMGLIKKIKSKVFDPTFMPEGKSIIEARGKYFVLNERTGEMIPIASPAKRAMKDETKTVLELTKAIETINKICNNTVRIEIDNARLLESESEEFLDSQQKSENRMRNIGELSEILGHKKTSLTVKERMAINKAGKQVKERTGAEVEK